MNISWLQFVILTHWDMNSTHIRNRIFIVIHKSNSFGNMRRWNCCCCVKNNSCNLSCTGTHEFTSIAELNLLRGNRFNKSTLAEIDKCVILFWTPLKLSNSTWHWQLITNASDSWKQILRTYSSDKCCSAQAIRGCSWCRAETPVRLLESSGRVNFNRSLKAPLVFR